jgi:type I restriction enzyme S subunit
MFYTEIHNPIYGKYLFHCIKALDIASMNVGSAVPSMTTKVLNELKILRPNNLVIQGFDNVLSAFYNSTNQNKNEIEDLINLRDTLLPKLISGQLELNEIIN